MNRLALASLACSLALVPSAFAQSPKPTPATAAKTTTPSPALVKMSAPVKGTATIEVIKGTPKVVGNDIVTVTRVKNTSDGAIAGLRLDEFWYDKKLQQVSGDTQHVKSPIQPGQIVEITTKSPVKPDLYQSQMNFSHANGKIKATAVKKFAGDSSAKSTKK